ncbi:MULTISPECIES: histidine phosphatase family protein [unclassified Sorangium]|uniref:Phosphoglycerate kinase n=1 Tax=Sorangium cellulosum TaxID=56 RepID=A0A150SC35_SORCE|nr:phosphoglycerate kinase [Sorangium cellulosum]KYF89708.1 phosphoglycerate kinase [Sorangium cellulosum]
MTNLYLIRHGEALVNVNHIVGGMRGDTGLTSLGILQAERLRDRLAATRELAADVLIASSFRRAQQTAEIVAPALGLPVTLDDDVQELRPGEADGMPVGEAMVRYAIDFEREPYRPASPGGESWAQFMLRVSVALDRITREHEGRTIAIVTHGGFIDVAFLHFFKMNALAFPVAHFATRHTSLTHWQRRRRWGRAEAWHLIYYNDSAHLRDVERTVRIPWAELSTLAPRGAEDPSGPPSSESGEGR